jgi:hypothetical protein
MVPKVELTTGRSLNISPPWRGKSNEPFDTLRTKLNLQFNWADPNEPHRMRDVSIPHKIAKLRAAQVRAGEPWREDVRETIAKVLRAKIAHGTVRDRSDILRTLVESGYAISRAGADYLTVIDPAGGKKTRLRGRMFEREWRADQEMEMPPDDKSHAEKLAEAEARLERLRSIRAEYNRKRYGINDIAPPVPEVKMPQPAAEVSPTVDVGNGGAGDLSVGGALWRTVGLVGGAVLGGISTALSSAVSELPRRRRGRRPHEQEEAIEMEMEREE